MTAKKQPAAKTVAKKPTATRTPLAKEGVDPRDASHVEDETEVEGAAASTNATAAETEALLAKANEAAGVGGAAVVTPPAPPPVARKRAKLASDEEVEVEPTPKHFQMLDDNHQMHVYPAGTTSMLKEHAEHWYAKANGVTVK